MVTEGVFFLVLHEFLTTSAASSADKILLLNPLIRRCALTNMVNQIQVVDVLSFL